MNEPNIKEIIIKIYSNIIEESIHIWLKSEQVLDRMNLDLKKKTELLEKIKGVSKKISEEFAEYVIKKGFPDKRIPDKEVKNIIKNLIKKYMEKLENEKD